jgi:hypothetical protein
MMRIFRPYLQSAEDEYLVVWYGDDNTAPFGGQRNGDLAQRIEAATGADRRDMRLSDLGPDGDPT